MLFHEVYGAYYQAVGAILRAACQGTLTPGELTRLAREQGFSESVLTIPAALRDGSWPLLREDLTTPLRAPPTLPLTTLEKRWLKTLLSDPRLALFSPDTRGLEEVEPLYPPQALVYFDRYSDGDPYEDPVYQRVFQTILTALREKRRLRLRFISGQGARLSWLCIPEKLEYSAKDDKFRLVTFSPRRRLMINLGRIRDCQLLEPYPPEAYRPIPPRKEQLVLELRDERKTLERALLHFSHLEKSTQRLGEKHYRLTLYYEEEDETELLIRVLSFGPTLRVVSPERFLDLIRERLRRQEKLLRPEP